MDSPRSARRQSLNDRDDIDPATYQMFKKMMIRMMSEQAEDSLRKAPIKEKTSVSFSQNITGKSNERFGACLPDILFSPMSSIIVDSVLNIPDALDEDEAKEVVREVHEGICGGHRLPNSYQANHPGRILLEDYAARLLPFCEEVCSMPDTCTFYSCANNIFAICHLSMAIFYVGLWCCGPHHSFCFKRLQIFSCRNRIFY